MGAGCGAAVVRRAAQRSVKGGARPAAAVASGACEVNGGRRGRRLQQDRSRAQARRRGTERADERDGRGNRGEGERHHAAGGGADGQQLEPAGAERAAVAEHRRQQCLAAADGRDAGGADQPARREPGAPDAKPHHQRGETERVGDQHDQPERAERAAAGRFETGLPGPAAHERRARLVGRRGEQRNEQQSAQAEREARQGDSMEATPAEWNLNGRLRSADVTGTEAGRRSAEEARRGLGAGRRGRCGEALAGGARALRLLAGARRGAQRGRVAGGPRGREARRQGAARPGGRGRARRGQGAQAGLHRGPGGVGGAAQARARGARRDPRAVPRSRPLARADHARGHARQDAAARGRRLPRRRAGSPRGPTSSTAPTACPTSSARARSAARAAASSSGTSCTRRPSALPPRRAAGGAHARRQGRARRCARPASRRRSTRTSRCTSSPRAGIGPEQTLGIARDVAIAKRDSGQREQRHEDRGARPRRAPPRDAGRRRRDVRGAPLATCARARRTASVIDVLQWDAIAVAVHPRAPAPRAPAVAVPVPAADAAGAAHRLPRDRGRLARRRLRRPGHARPAVRPAWAARARSGACAAPAAAPTCRAPTASRASGWPAATTSWSSTATRPRTSRAARASTPTPRGS